MFLKKTQNVKACKFNALQGLKGNEDLVKDLLERLHNGKITFQELKDVCQAKKTEMVI